MRKSSVVLGVLASAIVFAGGALIGGALVMGTVASQPDPEPVEVESPVTEVCRGLAFNLANEVYQLVGLVAAERAGDREHVDERLEVHLANWGDKVEGMAPVCGIDLPGER